MIVLFLDTETTGLVPRGGWTDTREMPYAVQISWVLIDTLAYDVVDMDDNIIRLPDGVQVPKECEVVHGISTQDTIDKGADILQCLMSLRNASRRADMVVGHNLSFDLNVLEAEFRRLSLRPTSQLRINSRVSSAKQVCTMESTVDLCRIPMPSGVGYKFPKLSELHKYLYDYVPRGLHNSLADVLVCMRCYFLLADEVDIFTDGGEQVRTMASNLARA